MTKLGELYEAIGGHWKLPASGGEHVPSAPVGQIAVDSQDCTAGSVFWAVPAAGRSASQSIADAFERGAAGAVVDRTVSAPQDRWVIQVEDCRTALRQYAAWQRKRFSGTVIAVAGGAGNTTARQMIHAVLGRRYRGTVSLRNERHAFGTELALAHLEPKDYVVLGVAATSKKDSVLRICSPKIGAITEPSDDPLSGTAGRQAPIEAELISVIPRSGLAILADVPSLRRLSRRCAAPTVWVGQAMGCDLAADDVTWSQGLLQFTLLGCRFCVPVRGRHQLASALIAAAAGRAMGLGIAEIAAALERFEPVPSRCEVVEVRGATIIHDPGRATADGVRAALELLRDFDTSGRRVVVCGGVDDPSVEATLASRQLGNQVVTVCGADLLIACGSYASEIVIGARAAGMPQGRAIACRTEDECLPYLGQAVLPGDAVLFKVETAGMDRVVEALSHYPRRRAA